MKGLLVLLIALATGSPQSTVNRNDESSAHDLPLTLRGVAPKTEIIDSNGFVDALIAPTELSIGDNRSIVFDPGVTFKTFKDEIIVSTYDGGNIEINAENFGATYASQISIASINGSWAIDSKKILSGARLSARRQAQDDTDSNLKSMQESARKIRSKPKEQDQKNKKLRVRWLFTENPLAGSEIFNSEAIQQLSHFSPIGF